MNAFIQAQIFNMKAMVRTFEQACELAATEDDGKIDSDEKKIIKKIKTASEKYIKELEAIN